MKSQSISPFRLIFSRPILALAVVFLVIFFYKTRLVSLVVPSKPVVFHGSIPLERLLVAAVDAARRGGLKVKAVRQGTNIQETSKGKTDEGANNPLTLGDKLSHREMYHSLKRRFPTLKIVSEEHEELDQSIMNGVLPAVVESDDIMNLLPGNSRQSVPQDDILVWIDPLDATVEYTQQLLRYVTTMVCVAVKGVPTIGVIHNPFTQETIWAWQGVATSKVMSNTEHQSNAKLDFIVSRSHAGSVNNSLQALFGDRVNVISAGGAGYKSLALVNGHADVYMHTTKIKKWDVCAGAAIVSAFGGRFTDLAGEAVQFDNARYYILKHGLLAAIRGHSDIINELKKIKL